MVKQSSRPLVGIISFTFNYGQYLDEMLDSLKQQTFQDFELYLCDDGSTDGSTPQKIASLDYEKIAKKILHKSNRGVSSRAREMYKTVDNKYIMVLCADDKIAPDFLAKTVEFLEKHPRYGAVSTDILEYKDDFTGEPAMVFHYDEKKMGFPGMLVRCNCLGSSLMRNQALRQVDFSGGFTRYQDWDRYVSMIEAGWKIGLVREPLFLYRLHKGSLSHSSTTAIELDVFQKMLKKHAQSYRACYTDVMLGLKHDFLELLEGKTWLEDQYYTHLAEIDRLNHEIKANHKNTPLQRLHRKFQRIIAHVKH